MLGPAIVASKAPSVDRKPTAQHLARRASPCGTLERVNLCALEPGVVILQFGPIKAGPVFILLICYLDLARRCVLINCS